jgi:hypothetical protein
MSKIIINMCAGVLLIFCTVAQATDVSGLISTNTTWTIAGSPYIVTGNILVDSLITLTIQSGVTVRLDSAKAIMVKGTLNAIGTATDSIVITKNGTAGWTKLWLTISSKCRLQYCRIEYSNNYINDANNAAIYNENSDSVYIGYCTISNNSGYGGIIVNGGSATITNNTITHNSGGSGGWGFGGIGILSGSATITNNTITNNSSQAGGGAINIKYYGGPATIITNNIITNNSTPAGFGGAISCSNGSGAIDTSLFITNNIISNNSCGSAAYGQGGGIFYGCGGTGGICYAKIAYNTITNNVATSTSTFTAYALGGGICMSATGYLGASVTITHNIIANNKASGGGGAIYTACQSTIRYNTITDSTLSAISFYDFGNCIRTNNIYSTGYAMHVLNYVGQTNVRDARYNYWNTTNIDTINARIFDYFDDFATEILIYRPFLKAPFDDSIAPSAPLNLTATAITGSTFVINWTNPSDPSGISEYYYKTGSAPVADFDTNGSIRMPMPMTMTPAVRGRLHAAPDTIVSTGGNLYIWLVDSSGNLNYKNNASIMLTNTGIREHKNNADIRLSFSLMSESLTGHVMYFELPEKANVSLVLFDISGKLVKHIYSGIREQGCYTQTIHENELSKGIYYVRFQAGNFASAKRFTVLR